MNTEYKRRNDRHDKKQLQIVSQPILNFHRLESSEYLTLFQLNN